MSKKTTSPRKTIIARAMMLAFAASISSVAVAQSNTTGTIYGSVEAQAGTSILIEGVSTGFHRTITPDAKGNFQALSLPVGEYKVSLVRNGKVERTENVTVAIGQGSNVSFAAARVEVTGRATRIDVTNTNQGASFTAKELAKLPIATNVAAVIQLAPDTTRGDSRYGGSNAPSFGGASASENAFYINGFPVTNPLLQVGGSELPFGSIAQFQILNGGYGAEFGRSTGGVVNITTKSGTNNWEAGGSVSIAPNALRSKQKNIYYPHNGYPEDGKVYYWYQDNKTDNTTVSGYIGGPIIKDKLFLFANVEGLLNERQFTRQAQDNTSAINTGWTENREKILRSLVKLDWNITDNHRLEFTNITDDPEEDRKYFGFDYTTMQRGSVQNGGIHYENYGPTPVAATQGADISILKYTGNLTDNLTLTALYGKSRTEHVSNPIGYNPSLLQVQTAASGKAPGITYTNPQTVTGNILTKGAKDTQEVYRLDLEYKLGQHTIRAGVDNDKIDSIAGTSRAGGGIWIYRKGDPNTLPDPQATLTPAQGGGLGSQGYYVERRITSAVSSPSVEQSAQYIEDRYQVTKDVLLSLGLRNEQFSNYNGDKQVFVEQRHQLEPRLGVAWDVTGNGSLKVFGNAGRYHLQLPTNVAIRAAGSSLYTKEMFTYTGVDPATGAPTGMTALSGVFSPDGEFGQAKDPRAVAAQNMKAHYQDEFTLGFEQAYAPSLNFGAKATYRKLKSTIDDFCDQRPFDAWAARNGIDSSNFVFGCALFNPGIDNDFLQDIEGNGTFRKIHLTAAELGYPKVDRTYTAIDLFVEHPFRNGWYGRVNYTWSRSKGNTEGQLLSDIGQADVATTQVWDFPEIMEHANGLLPNDRTHQIKAYGYYELSPQWGVGANLLLASGRPKNCIGNYPDPNNAAASYESAFFYCNNVATPRGSQGRLPWDTRLDMNVVYRPQQVKGLQLKLDVFNLFNKQTVQNIDELYNDGGAISATYGQPVSYTAPRSFKLTVSYDHKF